MTLQEGYYRQLNEPFRFPEVMARLSEQELLVIHEDAEVLSAAIGRGTVSDSISVWKGYQDFELVMKRLITEWEATPGSFIHDPGYMSTSIARHRAMRFAHRGFLLTFDLPRYYPAAWLPLLGVHPYEGRRELLLPRFTRVKIVGAGQDEDILVLKGILA